MKPADELTFAGLALQRAWDDQAAEGSWGKALPPIVFSAAEREGLAKAVLDASCGPVQDSNLVLLVRVVGQNNAPPCLDLAERFHQDVADQLLALLKRHWPMLNWTVRAHLARNPADR